MLQDELVLFPEAGGAHAGWFAHGGSTTGGCRGISGVLSWGGSTVLCTGVYIFLKQALGFNLRRDTRAGPRPLQSHPFSCDGAGLIMIKNPQHCDIIKRPSLCKRLHITNHLVQ